MKSPLVSVIMATYNCGEYIDEAVSSILGQSYSPIELIIVNDGSTDDTLEKLKKYRGPGIKVIDQKNTGQALARNTALEIAQGSYIAIMDADDISVRNRLEKQVSFLEDNHDIGAVSTFVKIIDDKGEELPDWAEEKRFITDVEIRSALPFANCVSHASTMFRAEVLKKYKYRNIFAAEDYDLFMRLSSGGVKIAKIPEKLYIYRRHTNSTMSTAQRVSESKRMVLLKFNFLSYQISKFRFGLFEIRTATSLLSMASSTFLRKMKNASIRPFRIAERMLLPLYTPGSTSSRRPSILFCVPWLTIGGADKVMLDLAEGLSKKYDIHVITTEVSDNAWANKFIPFTRRIIHSPKKVFFQANRKHVLAAYTKKNNIDYVFISNSGVGYEALPFLKKARPSTHCFDILHGQGGKEERGGFPFYSLPYRQYLTKGVGVSNYIIDLMCKDYSLRPQDFCVIHNGIKLDEYHHTKKGLYRGRLNIGLDSPIVSWVGRLNYEKHPLMALRVAEMVSKETDAYFVFAGDGELSQQMESYIAEHHLGDRVSMLGPIDDVPNLLADTSVLLLTSEMEGLPIILLEAAASGVPVVASNVGGVKEAVLDHETGLLVPFDTKSEADYAKALIGLIRNKAMREIYAASSIQHSADFNFDTMLDAYENVIKDA